MTAVPVVPDMKLELVPIPVSDVERAKAFYEQVGFGICTIIRSPRRCGSSSSPLRDRAAALSLVPGMGPITDMVPGSVKGIHLVVEDLAATRAALSARGVELSEVDDMGGVLYSYFSDPDGNMWALQQWPASYQS